jgi:hypothetical protein
MANWGGLEKRCEQSINKSLPTIRIMTYHAEDAKILSAVHTPAVRGIYGKIKQINTTTGGIGLGSGRLDVNRWTEAIQEQVDWYEIRLGPGEVGWVRGTAVAREA